MALYKYLSLSLTQLFSVILLLYVMWCLIYVKFHLALYFSVVHLQCYNPDWQVHLNQNSGGATQHHGPQSVQECLDYCGSQGNCVAADVDLTQDPPTCWPHFSTDDLRSENIYTQQGTNQYRLRARCVSGQITGFRCLTALLSSSSSSSSSKYL